MKVLLNETVFICSDETCYISFEKFRLHEFKILDDELRESPDLSLHEKISTYRDFFSKVAAIKEQADAPQPHY